MRSAVRDVGLLGCVYLFMWGLSWLTGDQSQAVFGFTDTGSSYSYYPGVLLGGLPPRPWPVSDAPQLLAAIVGAFGLAVLIVPRARGDRPSTGDIREPLSDP